MQLRHKIHMIMLIAFWCIVLSKATFAQQKKGLGGLLIPNPDSISTIPYDLTEKHPQKWNNVSPNRSSLESYFPPAMNQKDQGSCVAFATGYNLISYIEMALTGKTDFGTINGYPNPSRVFSPAFVYNGVKIKNQESDCEAGIEYFAAMKFIEQKGIPKWSEFPYEGTSNSCVGSISPNVYEKANATIGYIFYQANTGFDRIIEYISEEACPVLVGIWSSNQMYKQGLKHGQDKPKTDYLWDPSDSDRADYHAMLVVGYDRDKQLVQLLNSWGSDWGKSGYCWMPYTKFKQRSREFYIARPTNRLSFTLNQKGKSFLNKIKLPTFPITYRDDRSESRKLFKSDLKILKQIKNKTLAQLRLIKQIEKYLKSY